MIRLPLLASLLGASLSAQAAFFDDYSLAQVGTTNTAASGGVNDGGMSVGTATRYLAVTNLSNSAPGSARSRIAINGGNLNVSNDAEVNSLAQVGYLYSTPQSFVGVDAMRIDFLSNDVAGSIHVDYDDGVSRFSQSIATPASLSPFSVTVPGLFTGVNAAAIRNVTLSFDYSRPGGDSIVTNVQAVPEPSALSALGLGALALAKRRRRA